MKVLGLSYQTVSPQLTEADNTTNDVNAATPSNYHTQQTSKVMNNQADMYTPTAATQDEEAELVINEEDAKNAALELKEDEIRETECNFLRFIPFSIPPKKTRGVGFFCRPPCCPYSRKNPFFHSVFFFETLGDIGLHHLDVHRNIYFGVSTFISILCVGLLIYGASALSMERSVINDTFWASFKATNLTTNTNYNMNIGLQAVIFDSCTSPTHCTSQVIAFDNDDACNNMDSYFGKVCDACYGEIYDLKTSVITAAVGKFFALWSMQVRMYSYADSPALKLFGMTTELLGAFSLLNAVNDFNIYCLQEIEWEFYSDDDTRAGIRYPSLSKVKVYPGPGYAAFVAGTIAALIRFLLQLLTPLPRRGPGIFVPLGNLLRRIIFCGPGCLVLYKEEEEEEKRMEMIKRKIESAKESIKGSSTTTSTTTSSTSSFSSSSSSTTINTTTAATGMMMVERFDDNTNTNANINSNINTNASVNVNGAVEV